MVTMSAQSATRMGQAAAERRMTTRGIITRPGETDPVTGEGEHTQIYPAPDWPEGHPHGDGKMRVHSDRPHESDQITGQMTVVTKQRQLLSLPVGIPAVREGDIVRIVADPHAPHLAGNRYRIGGPDDRTDQTAHRVFIDRQV